MNKVWLLSLWLLLLCSCGTPLPGQSSALATVVTAEATLAASGKVLLTYLALPECGAVSSACWQPSIKAQAKTAYDQAYATVTAAQAVADAGGTPDTVAVTAAISTLQSIVSLLPVQPVK